ncbi:hypothetical protein L1987_39969 [Smallanthus sonchifolius]|uniref:Uncharacterized protein n=1 Tax=Smallanthus sonchifolius TaxID=185202 RepID=A0ACB9GRU7_9ASTR|nr:hypothetical protein L1987_39969 [Smallanthus sonchifolius]
MKKAIKIFRKKIAAAKDANIYIKCTSTLPDWYQGKSYPALHLLEIGLAKTRNVLPSKVKEEHEDISNWVSIGVNGYLKILQDLQKISVGSFKKVNYCSQNCIITSYSGTPLPVHEKQVLERIEQRIIFNKVDAGPSTKELLCQKMTGMIENHACDECRQEIMYRPDSSSTEEIIEDSRELDPHSRIPIKVPLWQEALGKNMVGLVTYNMTTRDMVMITKVFNQPTSLQSLVSKAFSRKNKIFYCFNTEELSVDIKDTSGEVFLPLITKGEIAKRLLSIKPELRKSMNMVHIGAVKILLKAQFRDVINFPIKMALVDNIIINRQDALLGAVQRNLAYGKFMFTIYPKFALHRNSKDFDKTLSFIHQCERTDLMEPGNKVFSINYLISYALTNSTHSIEYKEKENITIEDIFSDISTIEESKFSKPSQVQENWAINIARNKQILDPKPRQSFSFNTLKIGESSSDLSSPTELQLIRSMSERIDKYGEILKEVIGK